MPIVIISLVLKLREGPSFAFGARWALMQYHVWADRKEFLDASDADVASRFRIWVEQPDCPWYLVDEYADANQKKRRLRKATKKDDTVGEEEQVAEGGGNEGGEDRDATETEEDSDQNQTRRDLDSNTHILKMLYKGNMEEANRKEEQQRKSKFISHKHNFYRHTRCANVDQEEQSAHPAGVINVFEDEDDDNAYTGEQIEIDKEMQELRKAQQWVNQKGWDARAEGYGDSPSTGHVVDLRLDWAEVKRKLSEGAGHENAGDRDDLDEASVLTKYDLATLDPTQRAFVERVLVWAKDLVLWYRSNSVVGARKKPPPKLRFRLCGSAGSGKSRTL